MKGSDPEILYTKLLGNALKFLSYTVCKKNIPRDRKVLMRKRTKVRRRLRVTNNTSTKKRFENEINTLDEKLKLSVEAEMNKR